MGRCLGVAALLALALLPALATCAKIRGLDPELAPRYQPSADGKFACLDGKKSIPFEQVSLCGTVCKPQGGAKPLGNRPPAPPPSHFSAFVPRCRSTMTTATVLMAAMSQVSS
jgi:hypothetical protein